MKNHKIGAFFLFWASICNFSQARLGENYDQIEKRYGKIETVSEASVGERIYPEVLMAKANNKEGFDEVYFYFFRDKKNGVCSSIRYLKKYEDVEKNKVTPVDVRRLLEENFQQEGLRMKIEKSKGIDGDEVVSKWWSATWRGPNGEEAKAEAQFSPSLRPFFSIQCSTSEWTTFIQNRNKTPFIYKTIPR